MEPSCLTGILLAIQALGCIICPPTCGVALSHLVLSLLDLTTIDITALQMITLNSLKEIEAKLRAVS